MKKRYIILFVLGIIVFLIGGYFINFIYTCSSNSFDLKDQMKYVSCSTNDDCISTSCDCLNSRGSNRLKYLVSTCMMAPMCIPPSNCYCVEGRCSSYKNQKEELTIRTEKPGYSTKEEISFQLINNYNHSIYYLEPCNNFFNLTTYSRATGWISVQKPNINKCETNLVELASKDRRKYSLNPEMYDFNSNMDTHRIIIYYSLIPLQTNELENTKLENTFFSSNNFKIN